MTQRFSYEAMPRRYATGIWMFHMSEESLTTEGDPVFLVALGKNRMKSGLAEDGQILPIALRGVGGMRREHRYETGFRRRGGCDDTEHVTNIARLDGMHNPNREFRSVRSCPARFAPCERQSRGGGGRLDNAAR